ncbi:putative glycosyl transferase [Enhygromyxa salina]|uniref:Putative glycosyl transferase n=1 Tax=Enhygromyxa salina TaxID=215803 RepID=A0A2S9XUK5_9BACT|nr:glycosyltransferase family A protein [Enhygromyxa salina]PRP96557.1 putative glycosyl transferase [Enhygromyxa salina]
MPRPRAQISAVIPVRDRSGPRLENCLRSLRWQDVEPGTIEIVITDFGSAPAQAAVLHEYADHHGAQVVRVETTQTWNRARALNHGIQRATGRYVFCTDADMIFAPNFVPTLLEVQARERDQAFVVCHCRDLPERLAEQQWALEDFPELLASAPFRKATGTGACQVARREFFERVRGYDEGFSFWGQEDNDLRFRAGRVGLREVWIQDQTAMLHQWHPSERGKKPLRKSLNDIRYHLTKRVTVKNWRGWGERRQPLGLG